MLAMHSNLQNMSSSLKSKDLQKPVQDLDLGDMVSLGDAAWYSPQASSVFKPLAEMRVCRVCNAAGDLPAAEYRWLAGVVTNRMLLRKKGTFVWSLVIGVVQDCLVMVRECEYSRGARWNLLHNTFRI